jgi:O-antigen/teichoic acid export membrane protein
MGIQAALAKHVARAQSAPNEVPFSSYTSTAWWFYSSMAVLILAGAVLLAPRLGGWFNLGEVAPQEATRTFVILAASTSFTVVASVFSATLKGRLRFDAVALVAIGSHLVRAGGVAATITFGLGLTGLAVSSLAASVTAFAGGAVLATREVRPIRLVSGGVSKPALTSLLAFGLSTLASLAGWQLAYASDPVIVGLLLSPRDLAQIGLALSLWAMVSGVIGAFAQSFLPMASSLQSAGATSRMRSAYILGTRWCLILALPSTGVAVLWGPTIVWFWVKTEVGVAAGALLALVATAHLPGIANSVGFQIGLGTGLHRRAALLSLAEGSAKLLVGVPLVYSFGVAGLVLGSLVASLVVNGILWPALLMSRLGVTLTQLAMDAIWPAAWPLAPAMLAAWITGLLPLHSGALQLAPPVAAVITYFTLVAWDNQRDLRLAYGARRA